MTSSDQSDGQRAPGGLRGLLARLTARKLVAIPIFALIAIIPWLIPWHRGVEASPSADPSSIIKQAKEQDTTAPQGPDDTSVKNVTKEITDHGTAGYDAPVSLAEARSVSTKPGPYQKLGRLQIPKIHLDVTYGEGVFEETLLKGPGHWPGTPMPGRPGNSVISGHRNTHTQPFKYLNLLNPGDEIIVTYGKEAPVTYKVTGTKIIPQEQYKDYVLRQPAKDGDRQITLFACHPEGNPINRIVVQASASPISG